MTKLDFAMEIAAPPDRVWVFFVPQRMPYWYGAELGAEFEVQGGAADFQFGQKVKITGKVAQKEVTLTAVITRHEWGRLLEWQFQDAWSVRGMQRWEVEPAAAGTRVSMRDEYEFPGLRGRIADWLFTRHAVARRDRGDLARLKHLAERS